MAWDISGGRDHIPRWWGGCSMVVVRGGFGRERIGRAEGGQNDGSN